MVRRDVVRTQSPLHTLSNEERRIAANSVEALQQRDGGCAECTPPLFTGCSNLSGATCAEYKDS